MSIPYFYPDSSSRILPWETLIDAGADPADVHFVRHWKSEHGEETDHCKLMVTDLPSCYHSDKMFVITMYKGEWIKALDLPTLAKYLKDAVKHEKFNVCHFPELHWGAYMVKLSAPPPPPPPTLSDKISNVLAKIIIGLYVGGYLMVCIFIIAVVVLFCYLLS